MRIPQLPSFARALALGLALAAAGAARAEQDPQLRVTGMTFVGTREDSGELLLRSRQAVFRPEDQIAQLEDVRATARDDEKGQSFSMTCLRAELNIETNDFFAQGDVRGVTADGQHYEAPWVRYEHETGLLYTDAPVTMVDGTGSFRGDGFRYHVRERRFQLLGNVKVVQTP